MMISRVLVCRSLVVFACLGFSSCASGVQKVDLPLGSDPQPKLVETEARLNLDRAKQYDQLSPGHFKDAQTALNEAHRKLEKGDSSDKALDQIGLAMAQLQIVEDNGDRTAATFSTVMTARASAKSEKADSALPDDFNSADKTFRGFGSDIEAGNFQPDAEKISKLEGRYSDLELSALKMNNLGGARSMIEQAVKSGAKYKAPETYNVAQVQYDSAARTIEANRHHPETYQPAVAQSMQSAQKLESVMKTILTSDISEAPAVQIYDQRQQLAANQVSLAANQVSLQNAHEKTQEEQSQVQNARQDIRNLQGANQQYADKEALDQKIQQIKAEFNPAEADVVRDGSKIIIRLKTMKFSTARFELTSSSMDTLQKVKEMIDAVPYSMVVVEGHTDSVGTQATNMVLSQKRADSVRQYFIAEKTLSTDKVEAKGFGYERPLTSNKTKEGRATNRRVDVVIETTLKI